MLATNSSYGRRSRIVGTPTIATLAGNTGAYLARPRLPLKTYLKPKTVANFFSNADSANLARMKRTKARKMNGVQKMDLSKKKSSDYTEMVYREAVSKLKYLLAESYAPRTPTGKLDGIKGTYQASSKINESGEDTDDRSMISDSSRTKDLGNTFASTYLPPSRNLHPSKGYSNLALSTVDLQSIPPELTSFIEQQEEYIEQLERESQYCKDELTNLLSKAREVVVENDELRNRNKTGFLKCALEEHKSFNDDSRESKKDSSNQVDPNDSKKSKFQKTLEGPSIVFESRISELEAQLTQAKLELRKAQEENQTNLKRLSESCLSSGNPEMKAQLEQALKAKQEAEAKFEELQKSLTIARDKEADATDKAKRSINVVQQVEFEKKQCETEIRRLKDELDRQHEKLREAAQEASRRVAEERQQAERRYSQQVEQLSADVASHWDAANKSQLESEKQRREITELRKELSQKQTFIDNLKKELQNKISSLQSELNQALTEKDAAEQEVFTTKLATERSERQARQEQNRLQAEINSYKQRLERTDADLVHCRRENLRLSEQIASLEKEISMNKVTHSEDGRPQATPRLENEKELTSMIMDMETKHAATVAGLEDALSNQATLVSQLTAECQSLTQRLEANNMKHNDSVLTEGITEEDLTTVGKTISPSNKKRTVKVDLKVKVIPKKKSDSSKMPLSAQEEMASLQSNIEYLSNKIQGTFEKQKVNAVDGSEALVTVYNYNGTSADPSQREHNEINVSQIPNQEYNTMVINDQSGTNHEQTGTYLLQENNEGQEYQEYAVENKPELMMSEAEGNFELQNENCNDQQEYSSNVQNLDTYYTEQHYNQHEQYGPPQYEEERYADDNQYNSKTTHDNEEHSEKDHFKNTTDTIQSDTEFSH